MWKIRNLIVGFLLLKEQVGTKTSHVTGRCHDARCYWHSGILQASGCHPWNPCSLYTGGGASEKALALLEIGF